MKNKNFLPAFIFFILSTSSYINSIKSYFQPQRTPSVFGKASLNINNEKTKESFISFKTKNKEILYHLGVLNNDFTISNRNKSIMKISYSNIATISSRSFLTNTLNLKGPLFYQETPQWRMISNELFNKEENIEGWNINKITKINNMLHILGGNCIISNKEIVKTYKNLPAHKMINIKGLYHFIGKWDMHTGYMKSIINFNDVYLWTKNCKNSDDDVNKKYINPILEDFDDEYPICKIAEPFDVSFEHSSKDLKIFFGSTLTSNSCVHSYGISDISIYIK